jgi:hypothetical protein
VQDEGEEEALTQKKLKKCKKKAKLLPVTLLLGDEMRQG